MSTDFTAAPWPELLGDPGDPCGHTDPDHDRPDLSLVCLRAAGHPGGVNVPARDRHLADVDGAPTLFGEPLTPGTGLAPATGSAS